MPDIRTDIRVKVTHPEELMKFDAPEERRREIFWYPIMEAFTRPESGRRSDEYAFESAIRRNLPDYLRRSLSDLFQMRGERGELSGAPVSIIFTVTSIRYSSMEIGLGLEPLSKAVELFDKNFDYFRAAIEGFVPQSVESAILSTEGGYNPAQKNAVSRLQQSITFEPHVVAAFTSAPPAPAEREWTSADKARWAWIAANTSLLVPTVLAAIYLYVAHQDVKDAEKLRPDEFHRIIDQQTKMLDTCGTLLKQSGDRSKPAAPPAKPPEGDGAPTGGK